MKKKEKKLEFIFLCFRFFYEDWSDGQMFEVGEDREHIEKDLSSPPPTPNYFNFNFLNLIFKFVFLSLESIQVQSQFNIIQKKKFFQKCIHLPLS